MITPLIERHGSSLAFTWPPSPLKLVLSRFHDSTRATEAEVMLIEQTNGSQYLLTSAKINLQSLSTRTRLAKDFHERYQMDSLAVWQSRIEQVCVLGLRAHREGESFLLLQPSRSVVVPFLINPLIYQDHQTLWYAPGGSCKSFLALFLSLLACHAAATAGCAAILAPVLYLDYELTRDTVGGRLTALQAGHPTLAQYVPYYRRCEVPLHQEADMIAEYVATKGIRLLVVDSVALACGGDLASPDSAIKLQRALRQIGCASLVLAHVAKANVEGQEKTAYGTVFFRELARNVWEAERVDSPQGVNVILSQRKNNFGPLHAPLGFSLAFTPESVTITGCDPNAEPELEVKMPLANRIRNLLEDGQPRTSEAIADALDAKLISIKPILSKNAGRKWMKLGENREAMWTVLKPV